MWRRGSGITSSTARISSAMKGFADSSGRKDRWAWIATDQAFKEAVETYSRKRAYLSSLARQSDVDDFSKTTPIQNIEPLVMADWSNRNWEQEARDASATLRIFPEIYESRVTYYLVYATEYLMTSEGTEIRTNRSFAAIESGMDTLAPDGMPLNQL